ncbi:MAG: hypothetical protein K6E50_14315 [Lachnospiraceae bacterium]|nr:hypothetical protein [Lachnospiraceae bacterium]
MYLFFLAMKTPSGMLSLGILLYALILALLCPLLRKKEKQGLLRLLCVLPAIAAGIHLAVFGTLLFRNFACLYLEALLPLLYLLPGKGKKPLAVKSAVSLTAVFVLCVYFLFVSINLVVHNYSRCSYVEGFRKMMDTLSKEYCLGSWKKIDCDALLREYLPRVEEAEKNRDKLAYAMVLNEVTYRFYDSHVYVRLSDDFENELREELSGNDYGLSMIKLDDGSVIAVCTEPDSGFLTDEPGIFGLNGLGIHDGTQILSWDGRDIEEAIADTECIYPGFEFPVRSNEDVFRPVFLAGRGGESVTVTFLDDDGNVRTAELKEHGTYENRLSFARSVLLGHEAFGKNFESFMLDEECAYLRVTAEQYDDLLDAGAVLKNGYYPELTEYFANIIAGLEAQGMKYLVIDLRNNMGGSDFVAGALASLFTKEKLPLCCFGYEDAAGYHVKEEHYIFPDGRYSDLPVVVLVNARCMSAGDGVAKFMGDCPGVTLMGMTASAGVNQNNGGEICIPDGLGIAYPANLTLSSERVPLIDTDDSRENRIPLDVRIPMTKEYALELFDMYRHLSSEGIDPELKYAVDQLEGHK